MKSIVKSLLFVTFIILVSFKEAPKKINISTHLCYEEDEEEFVELMDGKIIKGDVTKCTVFKRSTFHGKKGGHVVIDGVKYENEEVRAVQYKDNRYRKDESGFFAVRMQKGKISVYRNWSQTGSNVTDYYFILKGEQGKLIPLHRVNLSVMVSDCPAAIAVLDNYDKLSKREQFNKNIRVLYDCIDVYNECNLKKL